MNTVIDIIQRTSSLSPLVDIGINLCHKSYENDFDAVLQRAANAGIEHLIITSSDEASIQLAHSWLDTISPAQQDTARYSESSAYYPKLWSTAGIHPHHAKDVTDTTWSIIKTALQHSRVCAVGETGLDFYRDFSPRAIQEKVFERHIEIAIEYKKPLFLHQREAHDRFLPILKSARDLLVGAVVHCFTDNIRALHDYLDLDVYIGITGWFCDPIRGKHLQNLVRDIPANRLLIETDGPYLWPKDLITEDKNSRYRNEPATLSHIARKIAEARGESPESLALQTTKNATELFFSKSKN
ncbi:MAG: TatD family hydrolase [Pseudomonadota bacterium]